MPPVLVPRIERVHQVVQTAHTSILILPAPEAGMPQRYHVVEIDLLERQVRVHGREITLDHARRIAFELRDGV